MTGTIMIRDPRQASAERTADVPTAMRAAVFEGAGRIVLEERPVPSVGPTDALISVTRTTICGTDVHITC